ncbi:hypothetical protein ISS37_00230 [candidate division KSB1 bacterium]|nr:hypothetical protein [candidate division KSB1 bacterium]
MTAVGRFLRKTNLPR